MSASLIGRLGVKRFQAVQRCSVDVARGLALLFGLGTKALTPRATSTAPSRTMIKRSSSIPVTSLPITTVATSTKIRAILTVPLPTSAERSSSSLILRRPSIIGL